MTGSTRRRSGLIGLEYGRGKVWKSREDGGGEWRTRGSSRVGEAVASGKKRWLPGLEVTVEEQGCLRRVVGA